MDLDRFPLLQVRLRNSPGSLVHVRFYGPNRQGAEVQAWYESSPTDDRQTNGMWLADQANVAEIARRSAGEPISRLTRIE